MEDWTDMLANKQFLVAAAPPPNNRIKKPKKKPLITISPESPHTPPEVIVNSPESREQISRTSNLSRKSTRSRHRSRCQFHEARNDRRCEIDKRLPLTKSRLRSAKLSREPSRQSSRNSYRTSSRNTYRTSSRSSNRSPSPPEIPWVKRPLVRFRRAARTVLLLLKATASSRHASQGHRDQMSWSQLADEQGTAKRTYDLFGISFDPSMFKAKREKYLSNEAKAILSLFPTDRTDDQTKLALLALNQTVDAFGEFPIKLQRSLASLGWYENFEAKRVIIRQGHVADNFYFILSGTAIVTILDTDKDTGEQAVRTVAFLRKGNSFGELALMHGARRSATVTCKTNVELLAVSREDFIDIFMHIEKDREPEHIRFLRTIDLLRGWPIDKIPIDNPKICLFTFFRRGVLLCKDSNTTDWIYVIKTGTCRVLKDLHDTKPNIPGLEFIPYSIKQAYIKLPPISHNKSFDTPRSQVSYRNTFTNTNNRHRFRLPVIHKRSPEQLLTISIEHQSHINDIYDRLHTVHRREKRHSEVSSIRDMNNENKDKGKVFVQIQKLVSRDVFGLEHAVFGMIGQTTSCSLVSDGAECILINKKFFLQHLTDQVTKNIRKTIQPIPTEESLQQKLQDQTNWDAYKSMTVSNFIVFKKQIHEHEVDALYL